ncbi:hypothetical protein KJ966_05740 [bacterium]|nr:hypothetical protein [bacterium]
MFSGRGTFSASLRSGSGSGFPLLFQQISADGSFSPRLPGARSAFFRGTVQWHVSVLESRLQFFLKDSPVFHQLFIQKSGLHAFQNSQDFFLCLHSFFDLFFLAVVAFRFFDSARLVKVLLSLNHSIRLSVTLKFSLSGRSTVIFG